MAKQKPKTKICKHCKTEIPYDAKICPNCRKRVKGGKLKWVILVIVVILILAIVGMSGGSDDSSSKKVGTVGEEGSDADTSDNSGDEEVQTIYQVGDILQDGDTRIVYMASGVYSEENEFTQPNEGYQYIYLEFAFENISDSKDVSISFYSFDCYADGYNMDMYYGGDENLSSTLSAGRSTTGYVYFAVPEDAEDIEVEYTTNYFTEDKISFVYEGEKDSGYVLEKNTETTEGAYSVGDIVEIGDLVISYLSCEADESDNQFIQPKDGYHYVTCEFEFENTGDDDENVSYFSFDCYADGIDCEQSYFRDDALSATISSGHKAKGTVTYEVPDDASVVEMEYEDNVWTSDRIVFICEE